MSEAVQTEPRKQKANDINVYEITDSREETVTVKEQETCEPTLVSK